MTTNPPPPRRKWHFTRWLFVFIVATLSWSGWRAYAFRSALAESNALGWTVYHTDPVETILKNWKVAFKKETWLNGVTDVHISTSEAFEQHLAIVHRLNPKGLRIEFATNLRDLSTLKNLPTLQTVELEFCLRLTNVEGLKNLSALQVISLTGSAGLTNVDALKNLTALQCVVLSGCRGLTNVDALENLTALRTVELSGCTGLTNVDALKNLAALQTVELKRCTGLTKESVAALRAALPKAKILFDYK